jgi:hypothetical protein
LRSLGCILLWNGRSNIRREKLANYPSKPLEIAISPPDFPFVVVCVDLKQKEASPTNTEESSNVFSLRIADFDFGVGDDRKLRTELQAFKGLVDLILLHVSILLKSNLTLF